MKAENEADECENPSSIGLILKKYGIRPDRRMGQNFLADKNIIKKEAVLAGIGQDETVLEIGPGFGSLTCELLLHAKKVIAIEKDRRLAEILKAQICDSRLCVIVADALSIDFPAFDRCVSNIPYEISSQVVLKLGMSGKPALLILQKEFAERLAATPGNRDYSRISVLAQYYFDVGLLGIVSRHSFFPAPKVDSAIVRLIPRTGSEKKKLGIDDEEQFFNVVRALFQHKNKSARNAIIHSRSELGMGKDAAKLASGKLPYVERKVDSLSIKELAEIAHKIRLL